MDTGDLLNEDDVIPDTLVKSARMRAEHIVELYKVIGIDAVNVGDMDLALGIGYLKELAQKTGFPFISANLVDAGGAPIFPRYVIVKAGSKSVGIFGLIGDTGDMPNRVKALTNEQASVTDAVAAANSVVEELTGKVDYIVALTHQVANRDWIIARRVNGVDLVVGGHDHQRTEEPLDVDGKTLIVRAGEKGQYLGQFEVDLGAGKAVTHKLVPLGDDIADDAKIKTMISDYGEMVFNMFSGGGEAGVNPAAGVEMFSEKCGMCHSAQLAKWKTTDHAKAYTTLFERTKNYDPQCLACHTVRFEQPGGFNMQEQPMSLVHVQCESCHGNAKEHAATITTPVETRRPTIEMCAKCHTPDRNPTLIQDAKSYMDKIKH